MADWSEEASFSAEPIEQSEIAAETPLFEYENLSNAAQDAVRRTIESPDGRHSVFGKEDWPDRFFYSDYTASGRGTYAIVYEGQYYRLNTWAAGAIPIVYLGYQLPFSIYGLVLGWIAYAVYHGHTSTRTAALTIAVGIAFHLLGPEFNFPLLSPMQFSDLDY